jgi:hypothetical protein
LDAPLARRDEGVVENVDPIEFDIVRGGVERVLRLGDLVRRRILRGNGGVHLLSPLIEQLDRGEAPGHQGTGAIELLLRQRDLGLLLREVRLCLVERTLRLAYQRLGLLQRGLEIASIHHRDDLACRHHVAFIDKKFRDAPGKLGVDVDLVRFQATIPGGDARWQPHLMLLPPQPPDARARTNH